jgi:hypothetical protein
MKELNDILKSIENVVDQYESGQYNTKEKLIELQRELASNMYWLTVINVNSFTKWNNIVYNHTGSNASGQVKAEKKVPELRITRKILEASKNISIAMSSELGILKNDN